MSNTTTQDPLADIPVSKRIDLVIAVLRNSPDERIRRHHFSNREIAELAGCSEVAIHLRQTAALNAARLAARRHGLNPTEQ